MFVCDFRKAEVSSRSKWAILVRDLRKGGVGVRY